MIINIEPTLVYYFMLFSTVIITPVLYYVYRIVRDVLAYQGRESFINQCAYIFKENESLVKNTLHSVFDVVNNVERNIFDYFNKNQFYGSIGYACDRIFDIFKTYFTHINNVNNSCGEYFRNTNVPYYTPVYNNCTYQDSNLTNSLVSDGIVVNDTFTSENLSSYCTGCTPVDGSVTCNFSNDLNNEQTVLPNYQSGQSLRNSRKNIRNGRGSRNLRNKKVRFVPNKSNTSTIVNTSSNLVDVPLYSEVSSQDNGVSSQTNDDVYTLVGDKYASVVKDLGLDDKYIESFNKCIQTMKNNPDMKSEDLINQVFDTMLSGVGLKTDCSSQSEGVTIQDCEFDD
ncbi:hypothetical protein QJ854_gp367 [Moumouvirus goulette]|uniref:Uncharacterized protein n=1 Tax=Moumouvirus goulette TaxID=1247379 RepID=M1NN10_9VIRU|nr:hypothetical protein QJ854_gp367 [Moumouvirus goulette]AGF85415.1 hypothetical protein glt_00606 [Moumouvirus goulette]